KINLIIFLTPIIYTPFKRHIIITVIKVNKTPKTIFAISISILFAGVIVIEYRVLFSFSSARFPEIIKTPIIVTVIIIQTGKKDNLAAAILTGIISIL